MFEKRDKPCHADQTVDRNVPCIYQQIEDGFNHARTKTCRRSIWSCQQIPPGNWNPRKDTSTPSASAGKAIADEGFGCTFSIPYHSLCSLKIIKMPHTEERDNWSSQGVQIVVLIPNNYWMLLLVYLIAIGKELLSNTIRIISKHIYIYILCGLQLGWPRCGVGETHKQTVENRRLQGKKKIK